jgi:copper(I)-binding protein
VNRALRAAALGVLLLSPVALSACSAGQVTQTESQARDKTGAWAHVGDIVLRQVELAYPTSGRYAPGDDAELQMSIVNTGAQDDALVGITGDGFQSVRVTGGGTAAGGSAPRTPSGAPASGSMTPIPIPADSSLFLGQKGPTVTLANLTESLTAGQSLPLTLTFHNAGQVTVTALVGTPNRALPRGPSFDFHQAEGTEGGNQAAQPAGTTGNG